jgi:hypothetical protein
MWGKPSKVVLIAVARRLMGIANVVIRDRRVCDMRRSGTDATPAGG